MIDWEEVVRKHGAAVWRTVYRLLNHHADAADCYQQTFVAAVELAGRAAVENWAALLKRIATRRAIDRLRKRSRESLDDVAGLRDEPVSGDCPVEDARYSELMQKVRDSLAQMPSKQAEIFCLRCVEGLTYREVARELGLPQNEVGVLLHRARARLQQILNSYGADDKVVR